MIWWILGGVVIILIISLQIWSANHKPKLMKQIDEFFDRARGGLCQNLSNRYEERFDEKKSMFLAASVVNTIFLGTPSNVEGEEFLKNNATLIENEFMNLKGDEKVSNIITKTWRIKLVVDNYFSSVNKKQTDEWIRMLIYYGLFQFEKPLSLRMPSSREIMEFHEMVGKMGEELNINQENE